MAIVLSTDFVGEYAIPQTCFNSVEFDFFIEKYEKVYLVQLMGAELYDLFIADLDGATPQAPQTQRFIDIFEEFQIDDSICLIVSEGMRKMMVQFIYFHYVRENQTLNTANGTVTNSVELGTNAAFQGNIVQAYNQGVRNAHGIQWFILDDHTVYTEENVQPFLFTSGI